MRALRAALASVVLAAVAPGWCADNSVDYVTAGVGSWVSIPHGGGLTSEDYFSKLSASMYATVLGFKTFVSVPLAWTTETDNSPLVKQQTMLGDLRFYVGRQLRALEPRVGAVVPLGYSTDGSKGWIGSGNARLAAGVAVNNALREDRRVRVSGEVTADVMLPGGLAQWRSWAMMPSAKLSVMPTDAWVLGIEVLGSLSGMRWEWNGGQTEYGAGFVPHVYAERFFGRASIGAKVGFGPSWKMLGDAAASYAGSACNVSVSVGFYP